MRQLVQDLKSGETLLLDVPSPKVKQGHVLIKSHLSLISLGTEKMLVEFGKASYLEKARQQPEKVKQVFDKIKSDGLQTTIDAVFRKLGEPMPLGYSNVGEVIGVGIGVKNFSIGDRVVSNGQHSEVVNIPENLVVKVPVNVSSEDAVFTVVGSIGLQGIRLLEPTLGETIVVSGLGLIGLISAQLLLANGCNVIGFDYDEDKVELARELGINAINSKEIDSVKFIEEKTNHIGCDGVLITASTKSNELIAQSAKITRKRGRVILVGVIGLNINRSDFYEKEIRFQVSCSYGPGRYENNYETNGLDYPIGFVRWTEKRNFQAFLDTVNNGKLKLGQLVTDSINLDDFNLVYNNLSKTGSIATIIKYPVGPSTLSNVVDINPRDYGASKGVLGIIGSGNFTSNIVVPNLNKLGAEMKYIVSSKGLSRTHLAKKYGICKSSTDLDLVIQDPEINAVVITTRPYQHTEHAIKSLKAGKHVLVEKPLSINNEQIEEILQVYNQSSTSLIVGFNRRFSPFVIEAKKNLGSAGHPINVVATMNSGFIDNKSWIQDLEVGGGRVIGEACHLIDLISFLTGSSVSSVVMNSFGTTMQKNTDNVSILLKYANGSQGVINYFSNGNKSYPKERIEIYDQGKNIVIDNFRSIKYWGYNSKNRKSKQDKGHFNQYKKWYEMVTDGSDPIIKFEDIINTSKAAVSCVESLVCNKWIDIEN